jgi:adenylate kinase family enzyme
MVDHIHILGASGSGTSTLGDALARSFGYVHLDTDDYFWEPTEPPFQQPRERQRRQALLGAALDEHPRWVLSGSLCGWGDLFIPRLDLVIFLFVPQEIRMARLKEREQRRFGNEALAPGGVMHEAHVAFMNWAAAYDEGGEDMRSRRRHEQWLAALSCPCLRLEGVLTLEEQGARVARVLVGCEVRCITRTIQPGPGADAVTRAAHAQDSP